MLLLYFASTLYHAVPHPRAKRLLRKLDHGAIYLLIAGTYTPFTLGVLGGAWGWTLFGLVWALAIVGVTLKAFDHISHPVWSTGLYLVMGWLAVVAVKPLLASIATPGLVLLARGRPLLHAGRRVLCARSPRPLRPLRVAPVRDRRHRRATSSRCSSTRRDGSGVRMRLAVTAPPASPVDRRAIKT